MKTQRFTIPLAATLVAICANLCTANPNHADVEGLFDIQNLTGTDTLFEKAAKLYEQSATAVAKVSEKIAENDIGRLSPKVMSDGYVALEQLRRANRELMLHGEIAGYDLDLRRKPLLRTMTDATTRFNPTQNGINQAIRARQILQRSARARDGALQKARMLGQENKWQEAFDTFYDAYDETIAFSIFLPPAEQARIIQSFEAVQIIVNKGYDDDVRGRVVEQLTQLRESQMPDYQGILSAISKAADALRSAPTTEVNGTPVSGPMAVDYFVVEWKKAHLAALRCRAIEWSRRLKLNRVAAVDDANQADPLVSEHSKFCRDMTRAFITLIDADASRASENEIPAIHVEYVRAFAPLVGRVADESFKNTVSAALSRMAAGSPKFDMEVKSYAAATDELLRWKERVAASQAEAEKKEASPLLDPIVEAATSRQGYAGLYMANNPNPDQAEMLGTAPEVLTPAVQPILGKSVWMSNIVGLQGASQGIGRYDHRVYGFVGLPDLSAQITKLERDLLITEQSAALTLAAAAAVSSAQLGDMAQVGGAINQLYLEGLVARFSQLPAAAWRLVALGPLPDESSGADLLNHVVIRVHLQPHWIAHRYFFVGGLQPSP